MIGSGERAFRRAVWVLGRGLRSGATVYLAAMIVGVLTTAGRAGEGDLKPVTAEPEDRRSLTEMRNELRDVKRKVAEAAKAYEFQSREYARVQHDQTYSNQTAKVLYDSIKQLEAQLVQKRHEFAQIVESLPEVRQAAAGRAQALQTLNEWREKQQVLERAIARRGPAASAGDVEAPAQRENAP